MPVVYACENFTEMFDTGCPWDVHPKLQCIGKGGGWGWGVGAVCTRMFSLVLSKSEFLSAERGVVAPTSQAPGLMFPQHSVFCH